MDSLSKPQVILTGLAVSASAWNTVYTYRQLGTMKEEITKIQKQVISLSKTAATQETLSKKISSINDDMMKLLDDVDNIKQSFSNMNKYISNLDNQVQSQKSQIEILNKNMSIIMKEVGSDVDSLPIPSEQLPQTEKQEYERNISYEINIPNETNIPHERNIPYKTNIPYETNIPDETNIPYQRNIANERNIAYQRNIANERNIPYERNMGYERNMVYGRGGPDGKEVNNRYEREYENKEHEMERSYLPGRQNLSMPIMPINSKNTLDNSNSYGYRNVPEKNMNINKEENLEKISAIDKLRLMKKGFPQASLDKGF
jgi:predicted  nucleic acid-binding Zn-ribbon protein